jgi:hypothetical protein
MTHSHWCKWCDTTWSCVDDCGQAYEFKKHGCEEERRMRKRVAALLSGNTGCKYGCTKECNHPPKEKEEG